MPAWQATPSALEPLPGELLIGKRILTHDHFRGPLQGRPDVIAAVGLADADGPSVGYELDDVAKEVRPMAAAGGQNRRVRKCKGSHFQAGDQKRWLWLCSIVAAHSRMAC